MKGSSSSLPFALHKHQQHSMNFFSASSPPALQNRCKHLQTHAQRLIKLGVYRINPEHDLLLDDATYRYQTRVSRVRSASALSHLLAVIFGAQLRDRQIVSRTMS